MAEANRDQNRVTALLGTSSIDGTTPVTVYTDDTTHELYVKSITAIPTTSVANSTASGTIDALAETVECTVSPGAATVGCQLTGTWAAAGDLVTFEATVDGTNWVATYAGLISSGVVAIVSGSNGLYQIGCAGYAKVRVRGSTWGAPGSASVSFNSSVGVSAVNLSTPIPPGGNAIGSVSVTSEVPGVAATNLGKARGSARGATDTGVAMLGVYEDTDALTSVDDGDYANLSLTHFRELRTRDQRAIDLCNCNDYTAVTVLSDDTASLANSTNHVFGTGALSFAKVNGTANTVYAGVYDTFTAINVAEIFESGGFVGLSVYLSSLTNVVNVFLRVGTNSTNYNAWTWAVADLSAGSWLNLRKAAAQPDYARNLGTGWNASSIAYVAFGVEFSGETNTLAGILFDHVHIVGGRVTASDPTTSISSAVVTPNVNVQRIGGTATDTNNGTVSAGTQRVTIASNSTGQIGVTNPALIGPAAIVVDSYTHVAINLATGADQLLVSSAANKQIWVYGFGFTTNVAGTVSFQDEDNTAISGIMPIAENGGLVVNPSGNFAMPIWKLATNKDLEVDIVSCEVDGWLCYAIVSV